MLQRLCDDLIAQPAVSRSAILPLLLDIAFDALRCSSTASDACMAVMVVCPETVE